MQRVAFIGLGNMGLPMAANLSAAGLEVHCFDLSKAAAERAAEKGCRLSASPAAASEGAEAVITMLPDNRAVTEVYLGERGLIGVLKSRPLLIDCSTIAPETARTVAGEAAAKGFEMIDAPVSGGVARASDGSLSFMIGGSAKTLARSRPLLELMGKTIIHVGPAGSGQVAKICNNMLAAVTMAATAEALALGVRNGLDPAVLSVIMQKSSGGNFFLNNWNPWPGVMPGSPASKDYAPGFQITLMLKDLGLALENARANGALTPMGAMAHSLFGLRARETGAGATDISSIQTLYLPQK